MALRSRGPKLLIWTSGTLGLLALVVVASLVITGRPQFCRSCHLMETRYVSWERSDHHTEAECLDCHAEPGAWGEIKAHLDGARYLYVLVTGRAQVILQAEVPEGTCIECHPVDEIKDDTQGVHIAHRLHTSEAVACETCHSGFHDKLAGGSLQAALDACTECHPSSILAGRTIENRARTEDGWSVDHVR